MTCFRFALRQPLRDGPNRGTVEMKLRQRYQAKMSINLRDCILMPDFMDTHVHIQEAPRRSIFPIPNRSTNCKNWYGPRPRHLGRENGSRDQSWESWFDRLSSLGKRQT